jgi:hypothetical protein
MREAGVAAGVENMIELPYRQPNIIHFADKGKTEMENWDSIVQIAAVIVQLLAGAGSTTLIDWLKVQLNLTGYWALALTAAVATVIAVATLVVEGVLTAGNVNWDNLVQVFILVIGAAHLHFQMLRSKETGKQVADARYQAAVAQQLAGEAAMAVNDVVGAQVVSQIKSGGPV